MNAELKRELEAMVVSEAPLAAIIAELRASNDRGISRQEVQAALEALRRETSDEAVEDRILEVMDFVSGFCSVENMI